MTIDFTLSSSSVVHTHQSIFLIEYYQRKSIEQPRQYIIFLLLHSSHRSLSSSLITNVLGEILKKREKTRERAYVYVQEENDDERRERVYVIFLFDSLFFRVRFFFYKQQKTHVNPLLFYSMFDVTYFLIKGSYLIQSRLNIIASLGLCVGVFISIIFYFHPVPISIDQLLL